jgi:hypothetical protein
MTRASSLQIRVQQSGANKVTFRSDGFGVDSGNLGTDGDPQCDAAGGGGGSLRLRSDSGNDLTIPLPCGGWRDLNGGPTSTYNIDYRYSDPTGETCKLVLVKHGRSIRVRCKGPQVAYVLGVPQGKVRAELSLGSLPLLQCAGFEAPGSTVFKDGSDGRTYKAKGSVSCAGSPSGAFIDAE